MAILKQIRGFRMRVRLVKVTKWGIHERRKHSSYDERNPANCTDKAITKLRKFGRSLERCLKELCNPNSGSSYAPIGQEDPVEEKPVPQGHLAVYVGEEEDNAHRVLVPVIHFNHPLFGDFLREAEKVYGFNHQGGIHVPCRISEFENLQTRISAADGCGGGDGRTWRSWL